MTKLDRLLGKALRSMCVPDLSNLVFDGKGEIEFNRRLSIAITKLGYESRVEHSVPEAKGNRTHTDIVVFSKDVSQVLACLECKSSITPDVWDFVKEERINNNFTRIAHDAEIYVTCKFPLYLIMWCVHWEHLSADLPPHLQPKYFDKHERMHRHGFQISKIREAKIQLFERMRLGHVFDQTTLKSGDEWRGCKASLIATVSRYGSVQRGEE